MAGIILPSDIDIALSGAVDVSLSGGVDIVTSPAPFSVTGVEFDGANDWLTHGLLTGTVNSKLWTGSVWFKPDVTNITHMLLRMKNNAAGFSRAEVRYQNNQFFVIQGWTTLGATAFQVFFNVILDTSKWHNILWSVDLNDFANKIHLYLNDVSTLTTGTNVNTEIGFAQGDENGVGASFDSGNKVDGRIADFWMAPGVYLDFSVEANRRKFINLDKKPVFLGADGSLPTGAAPRMFFSGPVVDWHINKGTGGGFTEQGELTLASTSPSD